MNLPVNIQTRSMARTIDGEQYHITTRNKAQGGHRENILEKAIRKKARENFSEVHMRQRKERKTVTFQEAENTQGSQLIPEDDNFSHAEESDDIDNQLYDSDYQPQRLETDTPQRTDDDEKEDSQENTSSD
jgi:hypothetical protein